MATSLIQNKNKTHNYMDATESAVGMDEGSNQYLNVQAKNANHSYNLHATQTGLHLWDGNARQTIHRMYWAPIEPQLPTNTDLNDVTRPGSYRLSSLYNYTNAPYTGAYGVFEVINSYTGVRLQRLTNDGGVWHRFYKADGTWAVWKRLFTASISVPDALIKVTDIVVTGNVSANSSASLTSSAFSVPTGYTLITTFPRFTSRSEVGIVSCYLTDNSTKVAFTVRNFTSTAITNVEVHGAVLFCKNYS